MKTETQTAQAMPAEQMADLAALQAGAQEQVDAAAVIEQANAPEVPDLAGEIAGLVFAFTMMAKPFLPSLARIYTEDATNAAAGAVASVCNKHGWLQGGLMGDFAEEVAAAVILLPLAMATAQGVKADIAENSRREEFIKLKKQADLRQHMNIAHNLDGKTEKAEPAAPVDFGGEVANQ